LFHSVEAACLVQTRNIEGAPRGGTPLENHEADVRRAPKCRLAIDVAAKFLEDALREFLLP